MESKLPIVHKCFRLVGVLERFQLLFIVIVVQNFVQVYPIFTTLMYMKGWC